LAYGEDWEYDYEEFVEWDAKNRKTAAATRGVPYRLDRPKDFKPLHPPVIVNTSWQNAKNNAPAKREIRPSVSNSASGSSKASSGAKAQVSVIPATYNQTVTLPDGTVRTITISSSGEAKAKYRK
jgi:hypothetical protein